MKHNSISTDGRTRRWWPFVVAASVLVATMRSPTSAAGPGTVPPPPAGTAYLGSYSPPNESSWSKERQKREYLELEEALGRTLAIGHYYYRWTDRFPTWRERWHLRKGRIPMISWAGYDTDAVARGAQDGLIRRRADAVKELGRPVFVRWLWEMDGDSRSSIVQSPSSFIAAWRRIHSIFRARGATNATFVWCPTAWGFETGEAQRYYPGDRYVDWICADGYNWAPGRPGARWRPLYRIFDAFYRWGVGRDKPMMIGEFGCQERERREKANWLSDTATTLAARFPEIDAVLYFDTVSKYDWRVDTSRSSMSAFRRLAQDPHLSAMLSDT